MVVILEMDRIVKGPVPVVILCRHGAEPEILGRARSRLQWQAFVLVNSRHILEMDSEHQGPTTKAS